MAVLILLMLVQHAGWRKRGASRPCKYSWVALPSREELCSCYPVNAKCWLVPLTFGATASSCWPDRGLSDLQSPLLSYPPPPRPPDPPTLIRHQTDLPHSRSYMYPPPPANTHTPSLLTALSLLAAQCCWHGPTVLEPLSPNGQLPSPNSLLL